MNKNVKASDLVPDDKNFNVGTKKGSELLKKSISKLGAGRSILIDKKGKIIAGNKTTEAFMALGKEKVKIIDTDGDTLIAVRRNDIDLDTQEGREMALADNLVAQMNLEWDEDAMISELGNPILEEWEFEVQEKEENQNYTRKIESPHYAPSDTKPSLKELCDYSKYIKLKKEIEESDVDPEIKVFLISAAQRHIVFNFSKVADYYAHSDKKVQKLMEKSALVIIDFKDAILNGYVQLNERIVAQYLEEHGEN